MNPDPTSFQSSEAIQPEQANIYSVTNLVSALDERLQAELKIKDQNKINIENLETILGALRQYNVSL